MPRVPHYDEPFHWWGSVRRSDCRLSVVDLLRNETIDPESGSIIWAAMDRRLSLAVVGGPSGLGKSTLLWALLELLPSPTRRIFIRGGYESFAFLDDPTIIPEQSVLLVNEISPHLPVYAWGSVVGRLLGSDSVGFQIAATAHAGSISEFVALLAGSSPRIPMDQIAAFKLVLIVESVADAARAPSERRLTEIWQLTKTKSGIRMRMLYGQTSHDISQKSHNLPDPHAPFMSHTEATSRSRWLRKVRDGEEERIPPHLFWEGD